MKVAIRALLSFVALWCVSACSQAPRTENVGQNVETLNFPVTVTLTAPNGVSPIAPVISGSTAVTLGARAQVVTGLTVSMGSGGVASDPDGRLNETWSRGTANLKDRVQVRGTLHAQTRVFGQGVTVTTSDLNPAFDPASVLSWKVTYPGGTANNVTVNSGTQALAPGKYAAVTVNSPGAITLKSGAYYLGSLTVQSGAVVNVDQSQGPVIVYTTDTLVLRGKFVPPAGTEPDLALIYLGTNPVFVETVFDGAILAPSATLTLRSVNATHTGFFFAKTTALDAGALVQYRIPLAVVGAANPPGATCTQLLAGNVPAPSIDKYCTLCVSDADTDRDHVLDCLDDCPSDPAKTAPGACGCGIPDIDTDGDGVPDCLDACEFDPNNNSDGQCGCLQAPGKPSQRKPAGTHCNDTGCPQTGATCNANGVCGNRAACVPANGCRFVTYNQTSYWFCPGPLTRSAAVASCRAKQMSLVRINSYSENRFVQRYLTKAAWIGANSLTTSGVWRWSTAANDNGDQFWQGAATGAQANSLFSTWLTGAPAAQRCAVEQPKDGRWVDVDCNEALGYVCESPPPVVTPPTEQPPGMPAQPPAPTKACVTPAASRLPATLAQLIADQDAAAHGIFDGSAASPPPDGSTCQDAIDASALGDFDAGAGCRLLRAANEPDGFNCFTDNDCSQFGSNLVCRQVKDDLNCDPGDGSTICTGHAHCGTLDCPTLAAPACDQIEVCNPGTEFDAGLDPTSPITPALFNPAALFDGGLPDASPSPTYDDPPDGSGKDHTWCFLNTQKPIPPANQAAKNQQGAGQASTISFRFQPDLIFDANVNPLSLGETDLKIHAAAQLVAGVKVTNLFGSGVGFDKDILRAAADIKAERCSLSDADTVFEVFGHNFIDPDDSDWIFDTANKPIAFLDDLDLTHQTQTCNDAVGTFINIANRAKKAFRDAQQLLTQYYSLKQTGKNLGDLCQQLVGLVGDNTEIFSFPGGLECGQNETPEITINRFIDYYQAPGGQIDQLRQAINKLVKTTDDIISHLKFEQQIKIIDIGKQESKTIVSIPFAIGPVPMVLQIDAFYGYGVAGYFEFGLQFPFNPLHINVGDKLPIAHVKAGVMPHADAGLSAFVGAGGGFGGFSATLGIEGAITLANLKVPIFAGAGIGAEVTQDLRPFEDAIKPPVSIVTNALGADKLTHFGVPTAFKFFVWYDYGAGLDAQDVMKGQINARLRVQFFFFSRTWRKQIAKFNGFSFHRDLVSGKIGADPSVAVDKETVDSTNPNASSTQTVQGTTDMGLAEPETPLAVLAPVAFDPAATNVTPSTFDPSAVQKVFYDQQCCAQPGDACLPDGGRAVMGGPAPCCSGAACQHQTDGTDVCVVQCKAQGDDCSADGQCCPVANSVVSCNDQATCARCGIPDRGDNGGGCVKDSDCCGFDAPNSLVICREGADRCGFDCRDTGGVCSSDLDCCPTDLFDTKCGTDNTCAKCGRQPDATHLGAPCTQASDCCPNGLGTEFCDPDTHRCSSGIG